MLFSDIEGSTKLLHRLGDEYGAALSAQRSILRATFERWHGVEMGTEGDSFFVVFASALDAVHACLEGQRDLAAHDWPDGAEMRVRMGIHTGEPTVHEDSYIGMDVHRAARIAGTAHGGQVVVSSSAGAMVADRLPAGARLVDLGWHQLKDLPSAEQIFQLAGPGLAEEFPALKSLGTEANLPQPRQPLVGRAVELAQVVDALSRDDLRLLTVTGPGGTGKTRLAVEAARSVTAHYPSGVHFVPLAATPDSPGMWSAIASAIGAASSDASAQVVTEFLHDRRALLVLDNAEQIDGAATVVGRMLDAAPHLTVLVTSRRPLHVEGEHEWPLAPLSLPAGTRVPLEHAGAAGAVALFVQNVRLVRPGFILTAENVEDVVAICRRLDGLPLAIELTAARVRLLSPAALLERLDGSTSSRSGSTASATETVRAAIARSVDLLGESSRRAFLRTGVFAGSFDLDALAAVLDVDEETSFDLAFELVENSLLTTVDGPGGEPRLEALQTIRRFAREGLDEAGVLDEVARVHADHYLSVFRDLTARLRSVDHLRSYDRLEADHDNARAALAWALERPDDPSRTSLAVQLVGALSWFWYGHGHITEGRRWSEAAVAVAPPDQVAALAQALHGLGVLVLQQGEAEEAEGLLRRSLDLWREIGDGTKEAQELNSLGVTRRAIGDTVGSKELLLQAIELARVHEDLHRLASALSNLAVTELDRGDADAAIAALSEALEVDRQLGDAWGVTIDRFNLAAAHWRAGRTGAARAHLAAVLDDVIELQDVELVIEAVELCSAIAAEDDPRPAAILAGATGAMRVRAGLPIAAPDAGHLERSWGPARDRAGRDAWDRAEAEGRGLAQADVLELVRTLTHLP
jgi:predicted ATPase/class 3 adenylate cyclase